MDIKDDLVAYGIKIIKATTKPTNLIVTPYAEIEVIDVGDRARLQGKQYFDRCFGYARYWRHILQKEDDTDERDDYPGSEVVDVVGYVLYLKDLMADERQIFKDTVRKNRLAIGLPTHFIAMTGWETINALPIDSFNHAGSYGLIIADGFIIGFEEEKEINK